MNGPFGNGFPYTNFHELNMDWIIRIAKDFLDQYTHIQDIISSGETSLQETTAAGIESLQAEKDRLEGLLDAWYTTHSEDIAGQLTQAISDFQTAAAAIGETVIASIPQDYTALSNDVTRIKSSVKKVTGNDISYTFTDGYWIDTSEDTIDPTTPASHSGASYSVITCSAGDTFSLTGYGFTSSHRLWTFINSEGATLTKSSSGAYVTDILLTAPTNAAKLVINVYTTSAGYPKSIIGGKLIINKLNDFINNANISNFYASLSSSSDLDNLTRTGFYAWTSGNIPANAPVSGTGGRLYQLYYGDTGITQICFAADRTSGIYWRNKTSAGWGSWYQAVTTYSPYKLPDLSDIQAQETGGVLTAGTYTFEMTVEPQNLLPVLVNFQAMYDSGETNSVPYVQFECRRSNNARLFFSHVYRFNSNTQYVKQAFRIPNCFEVGIMDIIITVPEGTTLDVKYFKCCYDTAVRAGTGNVIFHAHRGFDKLLPPGSYNAYVTAAELGFQSCVEIPKFTSDGVAVCFHNDGGASSKLSDVFTMPDGTAVPDLEDSSTISDFTYAELMEWSIGYSKNSIYADAKISTMDDFLRICAETGMRPIFSIHPAPSAAQWASLKELLDKYHLTHLLSVKTGDTSVWKDVIDTFGDGNIYSIINIVGASTTYDIISKINTGRTTSGAATTRIDVEFFDEGLKSASYGETQHQMLADAVDAGYVASVVLDNLTTGNQIKGYMNLGVSEFTNCRHSSIGLNW